MKRPSVANSIFLEEQLNQRRPEQASSGDSDDVFFSAYRHGGKTKHTYEFVDDRYELAWTAFNGIFSGKRSVKIGFVEENLERLFWLRILS